MTDLENLLELLEAWLSMHRQSILDGTISCKLCRALVLEENASAHYEWHWVDLIDERAREYIEFHSIEAHP